VDVTNRLILVRRRQRLGASSHVTDRSTAGDITNGLGAAGGRRQEGFGAGQGRYQRLGARAKAPPTAAAQSR
jgi:hypothetical protein